MNEEIKLAMIATNRNRVDNETFITESSLLFQNDNEDYCPYCANTGITPDNEICKCKRFINNYTKKETCLIIPKAYRRVTFNPLSVNPTLHEKYSKLLEKLILDVKSMRWQNKNLFISSPVNSSKSIFAYTCLQILYDKGLSVFPMFDLMEIRRILQDLDKGKGSICLEEFNINNTFLITCPLLFVQVGTDKTQEAYETMLNLIKRRIRNGGSTCFLSAINFSLFVYNDKFNLVKGLVGDGSYGTLEIHSYSN